MKISEIFVYVHKNRGRQIQKHADLMYADNGTDKERTLT